ERTLQPFTRVNKPVRPHGEPTRLFEQLSLEQGVVRERRGLLVVSPAFFGSANRAGALPRPGEHLTCLGSDRWGILCIRGSLKSGDVVGGDHLGDLLLSKCL